MGVLTEQQKATVWGAAVSFLTAQIPESAARALIGKMIRDHGEDAVVVAAAQVESFKGMPAERRAWFVACCQRRQKVASVDAGERVDRLLERLAILYGARWVAMVAGLSKLGISQDAMRAEWKRETDGFSNAQLHAALKACSLSFPPTLLEFCEWARQSSVAQHKRALPVPARTVEEVEAGAAQMERIKQMLGKCFANA